MAKCYICKNKNKKLYLLPPTSSKNKKNPFVMKKRSAWLKKLKLSEDCNALIHICEDHFKNGRPSDISDDPNFVPTLKLSEDILNTSSQRDSSTQTDNCDHLEIMQLKQILNIHEEAFKVDDQKVKHFTGLPNYLTLDTLKNILQPYIPRSTKLLTFRQILLVLMKFRLACSFTHLSYHFNIKERMANYTFYSLIPIIHTRLKTMIRWPDRKSLQQNVPASFHEHFGNKVVVIIDCFEIKFETSRNLETQTATWSNYKQSNTVKILIGITPCGVISFISECFDGRTSDKEITLQSGVLNNIMPGDIILAGRGFLIQEVVEIAHQGNIKMPTFLKRKKQLSPLEIEETRKLSSVRIHVERVIGELRNKYKILKDDMPMHLLRRPDVINQIVVICAALVNLCPPVVPCN